MSIMFDDLLREEREFRPSKEFVQQARITTPALYERAAKNSEAYWEDQAREIHWFKQWDTVMEWKPPYVKWFSGGTTNICYNCLDRHLSGPRRNKAAIVWEGERGNTRTITYQALYREVCKFANSLKNLGVKEGSRVAIYMPMIPEAVIAMLACARIGAIHSVVFGGFSSEALADRINDAQCSLLITADGARRKGAIIPLKENADKALEQCPCVEHVVIVRNLIGEEHILHVQEGRDHWYHRMIDTMDAECPPAEMEAEAPLFILYTSGTTGKPKGIVHSTGGYAVGAYATTKYVFDLQDKDVYWCTADVGWITGHSYITYGPLLCGATVLIYEGSPDYPNKDRFWRIIDEHQVTVFYTAPTAIRAFMKWGDEHPAQYKLDSLRLLGSVGEPINPEAWMWYYHHIGHSRCPIVDTWWQTETGSIMISGLPGFSTMKPGYAGNPLPGIEATILDEEGRAVWEGSGLLAITKPWPSMLRTIWGDDERYRQTYFSKWNSSIYFPGDGAKRDASNYMMVLGRVDDVLNVSGHRIGTMEVESALVDHDTVAEAAVVGKSHEIKGQSIIAFVTLISGKIPSNDLKNDLKAHVVKKIGSLARPEEIRFATELPKTRSGKIMRRLLKDIAEERVLGDVTTLADPTVVEALREEYEEKGE